MDLAFEMISFGDGKVVNDQINPKFLTIEPAKILVQAV